MSGLWCLVFVPSSCHTHKKRMNVHFLKRGVKNWILFSKTVLKLYILFDHVCTTKGNPVSSLSGAVSSCFFSPSLSPFLICTAWLTVVTPLVLLTDSSSSALLPVIKSCHGYRCERMEKCAPVAGHRGSQVDALTKLEEDTEKREGGKCQTK